MRNFYILLCKLNSSAKEDKFSKTRQTSFNYCCYPYKISTPSILSDVKENRELCLGYVRSGNIICLENYIRFVTSKQKSELSIKMFYYIEKHLNRVSVVLMVCLNIMLKVITYWEGPLVLLCCSILLLYEKKNADDKYDDS